MVGRIVQADVSQIVVVCLTGILIGGGLKDGQAHCSPYEWIGFAGVDEFGIQAFIYLGHNITS